MTGTPLSPFDLDAPEAYARWRAARLAVQPQRLADLIVDVADPRCLSAHERVAMLDRCARANMVVYRSPVVEEDKSLPRRLGAQLGLHRLEGKFKKFDAQITLDPRKPQDGKVAFSIDTASAGFGSPETDAEVPKAPWFNAAKFPQATFQSSAIKGLGGGKFEVSGKLAIKGQTRDVVVPVQLTQTGAGAAAISTATGSFAIKRLEFKIGDGEWADTSMVANEVQVKFKLALTGMAPI